MATTQQTPTYSVRCGDSWPLREVSLAQAVQRARALGRESADGHRALGPVGIVDDQEDRYLSGHAVEWYERHGELPTPETEEHHHGVYAPGFVD